MKNFSDLFKEQVQERGTRGALSRVAKVKDSTSDDIVHFIRVLNNIKIKSVDFNDGVIKMTFFNDRVIEDVKKLLDDKKVKYNVDGRVVTV